MANTVLRSDLPRRASIDKGALTWSTQQQQQQEQQQETPPQYTLPESSSVIAPSATLVGASGLAPAHEPVSESEWLETLRELQKNLSLLNTARRAGSSRKSGSQRFVSSLLNPNPFKKGSKNGSRSGESPNERQERIQSIQVLEELVLGGMRKLARIHPEQDARANWHLRAEQFAGTMMTGESANSEEAFLANEKEKETILDGLGKGLALLLMTPVVVVVFGTGAMVYGLGKCTVTLGHLMTFGKFR